GSATPQKTIPTPKPAENSIPTHDMNENSGSSSSLPNLKRPNLVIANPIKNISKTNTIIRNNHPVLLDIHPYKILAYFPKPEGNTPANKVINMIIDMNTQYTNFVLLLLLSGCSFD